MARIALLCSAHGFGHVARQLAVAEALLLRGAEVEVWTAAPPELVHDYLPGLPVRSVRLDVGLVQSDSLTEDLPATARALEQYTSEAHVEGLVADLRDARLDAVLVDIAPAALEAARRAGVPCLAIGNFDWAWIYSHYPELHGFSELFARWQVPHRALRMQPGAPLTHFAQVVDVGVVGRWRPPVRPDAVTPQEQGVLVSFGGFGLDALDRVLPVVPGVRWLLAPPMRPLDRVDCSFVTGLSYPAMVGGADRVLTKPGYGIFTELALAGTPAVLVRRPGFPEAAYLEPAFAARGDVVLNGESPEELRTALTDALARPATRPPPADRGGATRVADLILSAGA
ncbi:MAG: hypothetical protein KDA24_08215 [Deltaproteobacteria bacterium]|nr:hypothetical protein [Deltaproteobacteria bacterium]